MVLHTVEKKDEYEYKARAKENIQNQFLFRTSFDHDL
jgi:hypothetical protein